MKEVYPYEKIHSQKLRAGSHGSLLKDADGAAVQQFAGHPYQMCIRDRPRQFSGTFGTAYTGERANERPETPF